MPILFLIFFVIIVLIVAYLVYDYMNYKSNVDKSIKIASSQINQEFEKVIENVDTYSSNIVTVDEKIHNYDNSLKKFFSFNDENNNVITNEKMFNHAFDGIIPNLELISQVNAISGLSIKTSTELINDRNLKICNDADSCVNMNVNTNGFQITPNSGVNNISINDNDKFPLASFDLAHKSIYLGGDNENNSPLYIQNDEVHIKNAKMYRGNSGDYLTPAEINNKLSLVDSQTDQHQAINTLTNRITTNENDITNINNNITNINNNSVIVYYSFIHDTAGKKIEISFVINNKVEIKAEKTIQFPLNKSIINPYTLTTTPSATTQSATTQSATKPFDYIKLNNVNTENITIDVENTTANYVIKLNIINDNIPANSFIAFKNTIQYDGGDTSYTIVMDKNSRSSGVINGNII